MSTYSSIEELTLTLALYPTQKEAILEEVGKKFKLNGQDAFFVVAEDGNCALFDKDCKIDDLSKITVLKEEMISKDIKKINIPDSVTCIGNNAFDWCSSLESITISNSVTSIEPFAFSQCISLTSITIPDSVTSIGEYAFYSCEALESIIIPNSVTRIGKFAFACCSSLKSITIPNSVKSIGERAFWNCKYLKKIIFKGRTLMQVQAMKDYPWSIHDTSIIRCEA